ncbi:MAG TPA: YceI family protein [Gammaproteobacteria bacterium]|nr:YceI family protein [Gammaproteobacteria bacterium]
MSRAFLLKLIPSLVLLLFGSAALAQQSAAGHYRIDLQKSDIHWLVYKAGALSHLGHNHVIAVGKLTGDVYVAPKLADSRFDMQMPVKDFVVDNPELRAKEGKDFETQPTPKDIDGTRHNMLGDKVLDAEKYPAIKITGTGPTGAPGSQQLHLTIDIQGRPIALTVPTKVSFGDDTLKASGEFQLTHEQLGLKPFSIMFGALQVADEMHFSYDVTAERVAE